MKPRRWLGYSIFLNDLLIDAETILDRFETSEIPLTDTFGSSSDPPIKPSVFILLIGPGVEVERLIEILLLLEGLNLEFIQFEVDGAYRKQIYIGCNDTEDQMRIPFTPDLKEKIFNLKCSSGALMNSLKIE